MGNIRRKHESACNIYKNNAYETVCPPRCIPSAYEDIKSFCRTDVKSSDAAVMLSHLEWEGDVNRTRADGTDCG